MLVNIERLQVMMKENDLDGIVFTTSENVYYITGIRSVSLQLFPHDGKCFAIITRDNPSKPCFISSRGEVDQVLDGYSNIQEVYTFGNFYRVLPHTMLTPKEQRLNEILEQNQSGSKPEEVLVYAIKNLGMSKGRIGIDEVGMNQVFIQSIKDLLPGAIVCPVSDYIKWVRRVKTVDELKLLERSALLTERSIQKVLTLIKNGVTEKEIYHHFIISLAEEGVTPKVCLIKFGRNGVGGQVAANETKLVYGDIIWFDVMTEHQGYWADIARTFSFGEPAKRIRNIYDALLKGQQEMLERAAPLITGNHLFQIGLSAVRQAGLQTYMRHHLGHGIGLELYELPILAPESRFEIEENMVLSLETPYYEFGLGALHIEDPVVINKKSNRLLTKSSRALEVIE